MTHDKEDCIPAHEREKLPEEIKFDKAVYGGISYGAQALTGMGVTYWLKYSKGKEVFHKAARWLAENVISKVSKLDHARSVGLAEETLIVTTMVNVGNLFVFPVKWLENKKADIVGAWVKENDEKAEKLSPLPKEEKEMRQKMLADLKAAPKQSWTSLWCGRLFALGGVYAFLHSPAGVKINPIGEKAFTEAARAGMEALGPQAAPLVTPAKQFAGIAFYDVFYSMISAGGLYVYSHFIHPKEQCPEPKTPSPKLEAPKEEPVPSPAISAPRLVKNSLEPEKRPLAKHEHFTDYISQGQPAPTLSA